MGALGVFAGLALLILFATSSKAGAKSSKATEVPSLPPIPESMHEEPETAIPKDEVKTEVKAVPTPQGTVKVPVITETKTEVKAVPTSAGTVAVPVTTETKSTMTPQGPVTTETKTITIPTSQGPVTTETKTTTTPSGTFKSPPKVVTKPKVSKETRQKWYEVNAAKTILTSNMSKLPIWGREDEMSPKRWQGKADRLILFTYDRNNKATLKAFADDPNVGTVNALLEYGKKVISNDYPLIWLVVKPSDKKNALVTVKKHVA